MEDDDGASVIFTRIVLCVVKAKLSRSGIIIIIIIIDEYLVKISAGSERYYLQSPLADDPDSRFHMCNSVDIENCTFLDRK